MQDPDSSHEQEDGRFTVGFAQRQPPNFHVEALAGGFVVHYSLPEEPHARAVAHNPVRLARLVREWAEATYSPEAKKEPTK